MRALGFIVTIALCIAACSGRASHDARVAQRLDNISREYDVAETDMAALRQLALELNVRVNSARDDWQRAARNYDMASNAYVLASTESAQAAVAYREAEAHYRQVLYTLILAAGSDLFLHGVCGPNVSTAEYRRQLRAQGFDLSGVDVDHIIARARGGPNRPWNYQLLDAGVNRSLGANGFLWKFGNAPLSALDALAKYASYMLIC